MKVLAIVEINENGRILSAEPEKVFMQNVELEKVETFFNNAQKLRNQSKNLSVMQRNTQLRLDANFDEIAKMGFVHVSELDKFLEKKITEIENRLTIGFYWKKMKSKAQKASMWVFGKVGYHVFKAYKASQK